jgi:hypothetical protein
MHFSKRIVVVLRYERRGTHTTVLYGREFEMKSREFDWTGLDRTVSSQETQIPIRIFQGGIEIGIDITFL